MSLTKDDFKVAGVVLAGSENTGPLLEVSDEKYEALIKVAGRPMVEYPIRALKDAESISSVLVVGFPTFRDELDLAGIQLAPAGRTFLESLTCGLEMSSRADYLFVVTADVPLLSAAMIDDLVSRGIESDGEFFVPVVERTVSEEQYPGLNRTYVRLRDGEFTLGNCFLGTKHSVRRVLPHMKELYEARKNPLRMASILGFSTLLRLVTRTCSITYMESLFKRLTGADGRAVIYPRAEVALDIDRPDHLRAVDQIMDIEAG